MASGKEQYEVIKGGVGEITVKKSRFIGELAPVSTKEEAQDFINAKKKEYWDARHNCSAFIVGASGEITGCSDDGEPAGSAGRPMLELMEGHGVVHGVVVVTRYFGGVLLGVGGLVRAYQDATRAAIENASLALRLSGRRLEFSCDYNDYGRVEYILREREIPILSQDFGEKISLSVMAEEGEYAALLKKFEEESAGRIKPQVSDLLSYGNCNGEILFFSGE